MLKQYFDRLQSIDRLIRKKGTGTPQQFARRLQISERSLFKYLELMKDLDAPIKYSNKKQSYYYEEEGGFEINFKKWSALMVTALIIQCNMISCIAY
jgi:predicted DNA-binding transcriptional regulator YafY